MTIISRLAGTVARLPKAETYKIEVRRDVRVPMPDGIELLADHYVPRGGERYPLLLCRSPYGRRGFFGLAMARLFAERGFQVFIQSCRGTFGSGGEFTCLTHERADGLATIEWIKKQDWFPGRFGTLGGSYLGYTQWVIADQAGPELKAIAPTITTSTFTNQFYMGESFSLEGHLGWCLSIKAVKDSKMSMIPSRRRGLLGGMSEIARAMMQLPLVDLDEMAVGKRIPSWRDVIDHSEPPYEEWQSTDRQDNVSGVTAPVCLQSGWWDLFLPWMMEDYLLLRKAGHHPHLTIGPWHHSAPAGMAEGIRQTLAWHNAHLKNDPSGLREAPVKLFVMGSEPGWREFSDWPPPEMKVEQWHLQSEFGLSKEPPSPSDPDRYRYDPADPTPNLGGAIMGRPHGSQDNRKLEARSDVLVYTSQPLDRDLLIIGPVSASIYMRSSLEHTDLYARLCDVDQNGRSMNITDGLRRLRPDRPKPQADGTIQVSIELWPTAYRFKKGDRIRLQVSSGAHPRWTRNTGSGEPIATATKLRVADQEIWHDPDHPSVVALPSVLNRSV